MSELPTWNGWTNQPTYLVNLWLTDDEGTYRYCLGMSAEELRDFVENHALIPDPLAHEGGPEGLYVDLIGWALAYVDWRQLADALREPRW